MAHKQKSQVLEGNDRRMRARDCACATPAQPTFCTTNTTLRAHTGAQPEPTTPTTQPPQIPQQTGAAAKPRARAGSPPEPPRQEGGRHQQGRSRALKPNVGPGAGLDAWTMQVQRTTAEEGRTVRMTARDANRAGKARAKKRPQNEVHFLAPNLGRKV